ncbi:MAG TPA: hypothetical protein VID47_16670 [Actinomycetota bacterium]|jgi:hypothetical protein
MDPALESEIRAAHGAILDRFEQGLSEIEESARALMRSAAEDTLQGTEGELRDLREQITRDLSRDDAVRGLIAHADERYQAIDIRVARIEGNLTNVERAATALTAALGEAASSDGAGAVLRAGAVDERMEALESSLDDIRRSTHVLRDRLDTGLTEMSALMSELASRPQVAIDGDGRTFEVDIRPVAERLASVQEYIGEVVEYLSARDQALVEWIQGIAHHTDGVIAAESGRVEEALTGRLDLSVLEADGRIREAVTEQVEEINERLQQHAQTLGQAISVVEVKAMSRLQDQEAVLAGQSEQLGVIAARLDAVRQAAVDAADRVSVGLHERMADLVDQMRAESEDMRRRLVDRASEAGEDATRGIDERLARLAELVQAALGWSVDEIDKRIHREILRAVSVGMADFIAAMDRRFVDLGTQMDERLTFISKGIDGRVDLLGRQVDERLGVTDRALRAGLGALEESITERSTQAVDSLLDAKLTPAGDRIAGQVEAARAAIEETVVRNVAQRADALTQLVDDRGLFAARLVEERTSDLARQVDERAAATLLIVEQRAEATSRAIEERTAAAAKALEEAMSRGLNDRVAALAAMIRSDNMAIASRLAVVEEQAAAKEAIRAIKELAAALPQQISEAMDERLAVLGELFRRENKHTVDTVARAATALADRLDKTAVVIGERFGRDVEVVVDQIGTTMQTLASGLSRAGSRATTNRE